MTQISSFDYFQPILVCHVLPGLIGGILRWLYLIRNDQYKGRRRRLMMLSDIFGGLLVGTVIGPHVSRLFPLPDKMPSMLEALRSLPSWLTVRWFISAMLSFFWLTALETIKKKIGVWARKAIFIFGNQDSGEPAERVPGRSTKKTTGKPDKKGGS